jgi:serine/threonine-protein kinase
MKGPVSSPLGTSRTGGENKGRVLLVDDQPELLDIMGHELRDAGFSVETASDGNEALVRIRARPPEVVVADVEMPGMNGFELCRRVRAAGHDEIPFLFCSGLGAPGAQLEGLQAGADDYIIKPARPEELILKLTRQVERVRKLRAAASAAGPPLNAAELAAIEARLRGGAGIVQLGRFELRGILGSGSMGTVFRAWDIKLERWVAIKTVRAGTGMSGFWDDDLVRRLVSEATMVARFNHPHVVAVYDVQDAADAAYFVMEFVEGASLQELLGNGGRLGPERAVPLLGALASALAAAHAVHLLHRDVKPGNVLLGRDGAIKLTDFGIASFVASRMQGGVFGTPGYLPPEALQGEPVDERGDLFALGAIASRCLTGKPPFKGSTPADILTSTINARVPKLRESGAEIPHELEAIVAGLLEPDPKKRIADAALLADELARMSAFWGWRWTMPAMSGAGSGAPEAASNVPHAQLFATMKPRTHGKG